MVWHRCQPGALSSPKPRRLTAGVNTSSVRTGCVGHTSVHSDSGPCAWGSGVCARCVEQHQHSSSVRARVVLNSSSTLSAMPPSIAIATPVLGGPGTMRARCVEQQQQHS